MVCLQNQEMSNGYNTVKSGEAGKRQTAGMEGGQMKVVISGYVGKKITGIGRNLESLLEHSDSAVKYIVYANKDIKDDFAFHNPNVTVKTYAISRDDSLKNLLWTTFVFPIMALREGADRVLIPNFTLLLFKVCPTVIIMHDLIEFNVPDKFSRIKMFYRTRLADPISAKRADRIITVSKNSKRDIVRFLKVSPEKVHVVYNGVDQKKFSRMRQEKADKIIRERKWPLDFLLYVGTIDHPGKNAMGVIQAYEKLRTAGLYTGSLILAGMPGANYEAVDNYAKKSKYKDDIIFTGFVTDAELVALYSRCAVFIFISLYEGFGIPPLEALSCGAKVVVSNTSSLPEVVGNVGTKVDPTDIDAVAEAVAMELRHDRTEEEKQELTKHLMRYDWYNLSRRFESVLIGNNKNRKQL